MHKNASESEKDEFLQEALLMSNFKHEHILQLLGVCLDNDPQFIILELMEGGDLLSYLRASRPSVVSDEHVGCVFYTVHKCDNRHIRTDGPTERISIRSICTTFCVASYGKILSAHISTFVGNAVNRNNIFTCKSRSEPEHARVD